MKIIQQDILALEEGMIFHQVNCKGIMGGGIAAILAAKYPGLEPSYQKFIKNNQSPTGGSSSMLGKVCLYRPDPSKPLWIVNIFGQDSISRSMRMTSYDATVDAFEFVERMAATCNWSKIQNYFPYKMGCGLGGGDWSIYSAIIERYFPDAIVCKHE